VTKIPLVEKDITQSVISGNKSIELKSGQVLQVTIDGKSVPELEYKVPSGYKVGLVIKIIGKKYKE